ncbi:MAG: hypothetical protein F4Y46_08170, partial [Chloroflexi bacterium]|nr:hypothetical protein [Chloroflexota bacterium]
MEFGKLTIDNPNAPARGPVAGDYAPVVVAPFAESGCQVEFADGGSASAALAGIRLTTHARKRIFGLPIGPRPRRGFTNQKWMGKVPAITQSMYQKRSGPRI